MADDILDEMEDDFEDDMSDLLEDDMPEDDASEEMSDSTADKRKGGKISSLINGVASAGKQLAQKLFGSTKSIIIFAVTIVLLISTVLILWLFVFSSSQDEVLQPSQEGSSDVLTEPPPEEEIIFEDIVDLEPFERIPLKTSSTMGLVSLHLSLELTDARYRKQIYAMEDRIRSIVMNQVGNTTWLELRNPEGKIMLKYNLIQRLNAIFPDVTVRNLYFTFFIMQ